MKKELLDALKAKFVGVSDAILGRIADRLAKTASSDEDVANLVEGVTFQQVLESYGDSRATEAQQSAVTNYEKKHGLKDGKRVEEPKKEEPKKEEGDDLASQIAAAVAAAMKPLNDELAAMKSEKTAVSRKERLAGILGKAPEKVRERYEKDFGRMSFKDDEDFNSWVDEITPDVEAITNDFASKGGVVTRPKGGSGGSATGADNPHLKARIQEKAAEVATSAIVGGLPNKTN
jgi:hypothetical protein